jgi:hypothetical protein
MYLFAFILLLALHQRSTLIPVEIILFNWPASCTVGNHGITFSMTVKSMSTFLPCEWLDDQAITGGVYCSRATPRPTSTLFIDPIKVLCIEPKELPDSVHRYVLFNYLMASQILIHSRRLLPST